MQDTQDFFNVLTIALVLAFITLILLDFFAGLLDLWNQLDKKESKAIDLLAHKLEAQRTTALPYLKPTSKLIHIKIPSSDYIALNKTNDIDTESLAFLIKQLPQTRIRTAARRLGIADKVNGKYQKLGVLRTQLQAKLKCQPTEVARVLNGLGTSSASA